MGNTTLNSKLHKTWFGFLHADKDTSKFFVPITDLLPFAADKTQINYHEQL